ncbi:hypothetical protein AB1Y20_004178 [Prymnesium parvum]|uniref:Telomeric repeat-binding factor 2-interacting protein 1 n=1 Tax=Prymnesium parvum TaxID=97485 RepID=A0AB34J9H6_PRYPA
MARGAGKAKAPPPPPPPPPDEPDPPPEPPLEPPLRALGGSDARSQLAHFRRVIEAAVGPKLSAVLDSWSDLTLQAWEMTEALGNEKVALLRRVERADRMRDDAFRQFGVQAEEKKQALEAYEAAAKSNRLLRQELKLLTHMREGKKRQADAPAAAAADSPPPPAAKVARTAATPPALPSLPPSPPRQRRSSRLALEVCAPASSASTAAAGKSQNATPRRHEKPAAARPPARGEGEEAEATPVGRGAADTQLRGGSRRRVKWSADEENELRRLVEEHGAGMWKAILIDGRFQPFRTAIDLKDKWRNMQKKE